MNNKKLVGVVSIILLLIAVCFAKFNGDVLGAKRDPLENEEEVEAYFYTNRTGKSSKYITYKECEEVGVGTIIIEKDAEALQVRNSPNDVLTYLNEIPDYYAYLADNEDIKWMTIYRSRGVYRVIGEIIEVEERTYSEAEEDYEPEAGSWYLMKREAKHR